MRAFSKIAIDTKLDDIVPFTIIQKHYLYNIIHQTEKT